MSGKNVLRYWTEAFENDPFYLDPHEQESSINRVSSRSVLDNLKKKEWKEIKEGLDQISKYLEYQSSLPSDEERTDILKAVSYHIDNPSVVTRHAVLTLKKIVTSSDNFTNTEWELIFLAFINYYSVASSKYMMEAVEETLKHIVDTIPYQKSALILTTVFKKIKYKKSQELAAKLLKKVAVELGPYNIFSENNMASNILKIAVKLLSLQSDTTRYYGKKILDCLMSSRTFEELLNKNVPPNLRQMTNEVVNVIKTKGVGKRFKHKEIFKSDKDKKILLQGT